MSEQNSSALDWELEGNNLIEASAGTGKTYNIQTLFSRMIIEKNYSVDTILVNTFTEAATKELKSRIRDILKNIQIELSKNTYNIKKSSPNRINGIIASARDKDIPKQLIKQRVEQALNNFSTASIYTIHGFCNKILNEAAFETGTLFDTEFLEDDSEIIDDILAEFYRKEFYNKDIFIQEIIEELNLTLSDLRNFIKEIIGEQDSKFIPPLSQIKNICPSDLSQKYQELIQNFESKNFADKFLLPLISENVKKNRRDKTKRTIQVFNEVLSGNIKKITKLKSDRYYYLSKEKFLDNCYKKKTDKIKNEVPQKLELLDQINKQIYHFLNDYIEQFELSVKKRLYNYFLKKYKQEKKQRNIKTYDDMISEVRNKIIGEEGNNLINFVREEYKAALIDEFQDTSPYQYDILKTIFVESRSHPIFFVGDDKQAIYGFRGGDIYTYHRAKKELKGNKYTLDKNWRSLPNLVSAFNHLFSRELGPNPFVNDFINYQKVKAEEFDPVNDLEYNGEMEPSPFKLLFYDQECNTRTLSKIATRHTAKKIFNLLNNDKYCLNSQNRSIKPGDIAILVDKHSQSDKIEQKLRDWNIPVSTQATGDIFQTKEAQDMAYFLEAVKNPEDLNAIKTALSRKLFEVNYKDLIEYSESNDLDKQNEFENWITLFLDLQEEWESYSFIKMFHTFIEDAKVGLKKKILARANGERELVNYMHLAELINKEETENNREMSGIIVWYNKKLENSDSVSQEEKEIRLDTDRSSVQVMTIHHSKGLEFPIVFCPFLWTRTTHLNNKALPKFHDENNELKIEISEDKDYKNMASDERLEEIMRLLYVAMTRAESQCYIIWGKVKGRKRKNGLTYLFNRNEIYQAEPEKGEIADKLKNINKDWNYKPAQEELAPEIELTEIEEQKIKTQKYKRESKELQGIKKFDADTSQKWQVASFSQIVSYKKTNEFEEDKDFDASERETKYATNPEEIDLEQQYSIFDFPGGVQTGSCWHKIFEDLDFLADEESIKEAVEEKLSFYNLITADSNLRKTKIRIVNNMVQKVLNKNLNGDELKLSHIGHNDKIPEVEFGFSISDNISKEHLLSLLSQYNYKNNIHKNITQGMLKGFIDLVFRKDAKYYIVDWKSNKLGKKHKDYNQERLYEEMQQKNYNLQYILYTLALYKFLKRRLKNFDYDENFGGVYYLFLRGITDRNDRYGIYFDKPDFDLIQRLDSLI